MSLLRFPQSRSQFGALLLGWYQRHKRDLPWRENPSPYRIWLSEVMLQQTQVGTMVPFFNRILERFPDLETLARAPLEELLSLWSGLGYYNRARNLHRAAKQVRRDFGGNFPRSLQQALKLPGVGRYTAGAVLSIAYHLPYPVLDGNVRRLMARYLKIEGPIDSAVEQQLWDTLADLVALPGLRSRVADFNQALMELGSLVCRPRHPQCLLCPLKEKCRARRQGRQHDLPHRVGSRKSAQLHFSAAVICRDGNRYLMHQNDQGPYLKGFWEFPKVEGRPEKDLTHRFLMAHRLHLRVESVLPPIRHQITFRRLHLHPVIGRLSQPPEESKWVWSKLGATGRPASAFVTKIAKAVMGSRLAQ